MLAISEKVVIRANDLLTWLDDRIKWTWGLQASVSKKNCEPIKSISLKNTQIDFSEVDQEKGKTISINLYENMVVGIRKFTQVSSIVSTKL